MKKIKQADPTSIHDVEGCDIIGAHVAGDWFLMCEYERESSGETDYFFLNINTSLGVPNIEGWLTPTIKELILIWKDEYVRQYKYAFYVFRDIKDFMKCASMNADPIKLGASKIIFDEEK